MQAEIELELCAAAEAGGGRGGVQRSRQQAAASDDTDAAAEALLGVMGGEWGPGQQALFRT